MDIERAVDDFVSRGRDLFRHLRLEGQSLSHLALGMLRTQLHILTVEAARLKRVKQFSDPTSSEKSPASPPPDCSHRRLIDDIVDANGERTGLAYCLQCGGFIKDPFPKPE